MMSRSRFHSISYKKGYVQMERIRKDYTMKKKKKELYKEVNNVLP